MNMANSFHTDIVYGLPKVRNEQSEGLRMGGAKHHLLFIISFYVKEGVKGKPRCFADQPQSGQIGHTLRGGRVKSDLVTKWTIGRWNLRFLPIKASDRPSQSPLRSYWSDNSSEQMGVFDAPWYGGIPSSHSYSNRSTRESALPAPLDHASW